jgi:hypothetical protein
MIKKIVDLSNDQYMQIPKQVRELIEQLPMAPKEAALVMDKEQMKKDLNDINL